MTHIVRKPAPSSQRLKHLGQCASSPGHRGYCYAELTVFFPLVFIVLTHGQIVRLS